MNGVATGIGQAGLAVASLVLVILIVRYSVGFQHKPTSQVIKDVVDIFSIAVSLAASCRHACCSSGCGYGYVMVMVMSPPLQVTIVVVAVPEGLPLAVTLT